MPQLRVRMQPRDPAEEHRGATPLELFFDLVFVVAVAQAAAGLHHGIVENHVGHSVQSYLFAFFAIWWAWMNFSWFASAYDPDDAPYRIAVFVIMMGVLIVGAGVPRAFSADDLGVMTAGYVVMRLAMVSLWLRAARVHPEGRRSAHRYALGIFVLQIAWVLRLALPDGWGTASFLVLAALELAVPVWAERAGRTTWHPRHMAERYGLFTIIVLGESILSATIGVQAALDANGTLDDLLPTIAGGLLLVFSMWWMYFDLPVEATIGDARDGFDEHISQPFAWGYGHYAVFAAAAATGAGIAVVVDQITHHAEISRTVAALSVTVPVVVYLVTVWALHFTHKPPGAVRNWLVPVAAILIVAASFTPQPVLLSGLVLAAAVAVSTIAYGEGSPGV